MYARSTTITADPQKIEQGIAFVRDEVQPAVTAMAGCAGLSLLVDRASGRCIVTTSWETRDALSASAGAVRPLRERGGEVMGGEPTVDEWEVALMHRLDKAPEGACCRVGWIDLHGMGVDAFVDAYRERLIPRLETLEGFRSVSVMIDPSTGTACGTLTFVDRAALDNTRDRNATMRQVASEELGIRFTDVAEFDLVIHHLRVPELV